VNLAGISVAIGLVVIAMTTMPYGVVILIGLAWLVWKS